MLSIHGHPQTAYPYFAGYKDEQGDTDGKGYNKNYPLYPGADDAKYLKVLDDAITHIKKFKPNYLVISLGFDIMKGDPTGAFLISKKGMEEIGKRFTQLNVPILVVQEGGYSLQNLRAGAKSFFKGITTPCETLSL